MNNLWKVARDYIRIVQRTRRLYNRLILEYLKMKAGRDRRTLELYVVFEEFFQESPQGNTRERVNDVKIYLKAS